MNTTLLQNRFVCASGYEQGVRVVELLRMCATECAIAQGACHSLRVWDSRHRGRVCVRSGRMQRHPWGSCLCGDVVQGAPCKGAGRQWVRCALGARSDCGGPRRAHAVLPEACSLWRSREPGGRWSRLRWSRDADAISAPQSGREGARWWGVAMAVSSAPGRGYGERARSVPAVPQARITNGRIRSGIRHRRPSKLTTNKLATNEIQPRFETLHSTRGLGAESYITLPTLTYTLRR